MQFLTGGDLHRAIADLDKHKRLWCAVAFWGKGAENLFKVTMPGDRRLICNLQMGGTNPNVIEKFKRSKIRQVNNLHAKVYIGDNCAIISSANASANGLGLEGNEQNAWSEAGIKTSDLAPILDWFNGLWKSSACKEIHNADLTKAKAAWKLRQKAKPPLTASLSSFADFNMRSNNLPLITWWNCSVGWKTDKNSLKRQGEMYSETLDDLIAAGVEIEGDDDERNLQRGQPVLFWKMKQDGSPANGKSCFEWLEIDRLIRKAGRCNSEPIRDVAISYPRGSFSPPFDTGDRYFQTCFSEIICQQKYDELRVDDYGKGTNKAWFTDERVALMKEFWADLKIQYKRRQSGN